MPCWMNFSARIGAVVCAACLRLLRRAAETTTNAKGLKLQLLAVSHPLNADS
jgi:hypothetical protein